MKALKGTLGQVVAVAFAFGLGAAQAAVNFGTPPKRKVVRQFALVGLTALGLSTGAEAAVLYGTGGSGLTFLSATSDPIDLGGVFSSFTVDATLGLSITSAAGTTLTAASEQLTSCAGVSFCRRLLRGSLV